MSVGTFNEIRLDFRSFLWALASSAFHDCSDCVWQALVSVVCFKDAVHLLFGITEIIFF